MTARSAGGFRLGARVTFAALVALASIPALDAGWALAADAPRPPQGVRFVYLIRHGMYDRVDSLDDRVGNGLSPLGHEQALILAKRLAALPVKVRVLVTSGFTRARETADDIGGVLGIRAERDTLIEECSPRSTRADYDRNHDPAEMTLCETNLEGAWKKYFQPSPGADAHDLIVCHGNVIRWFVNRALGNDVRRWTSLDIANASLTIIAVRADGTTRLVMYSDVGHLPLEKQTWLGRGGGWTPPGR